MAIGWVICAGLIYALVPALDFLSSLAIAACLTPTDPILAAAGTSSFSSTIHGN
jgi:sodium/hydrogen antiporter